METPVIEEFHQIGSIQFGRGRKHQSHIDFVAPERLSCERQRRLCDELLERHTVCFAQAHQAVQPFGAFRRTAESGEGYPFEVAHGVEAVEVGGDVADHENVGVHSGRRGQDVDAEVLDASIQQRRRGCWVARRLDDAGELQGTPEIFRYEVELPVTHCGHHDLTWTDGTEPHHENSYAFCRLCVQLGENLALDEVETSHPEPYPVRRIRRGGGPRTAGRCNHKRRCERERGPSSHAESLAREFGSGVMTHVDAQHPPGQTRFRRPSGEPPPLPKELNRAAVGWLVLFAFWAMTWLWVFLSDAPAIWITERDLEMMQPIIERRVDWLTTIMEHTNAGVLPWGTLVVGWVTILGGLAAKRIRHVVLYFVALSISAGIATTVAIEIGRPRPFGMERLGEWEGYAQPSRPITLLTVALVGAGQTLVPSGRPRHRWYVASAAVIVWCTVAQIYLGVEHPTDGFGAQSLGVAITLLLFRLGAPERVFPVAYRTGKTAHLDVTGSRGVAIARALGDQLGVGNAELTPVGLAGSAGSTPLRVRQDDGPDLFAKLYARNHLRSDRSYKLWRTLMYGRLEDEQHFTSVRRLVQHEDYLLHVMRAAGVDTMEPIGIVEITPDREYLLVTEFLTGAQEISDVEVSDDLIDQGVQTVHDMWRAGLAHRDIKPANVMVHDGRLRLIDVSFGEIRPSPWRQAVDLANMMLVLALRSSPERVYERATRWFTEADIAEAFAASRGVTLPSALRADVRRDGRELLDRFRELAPQHSPVSIQRWSLRRLALSVWVTFVVLFLAAVFLGNLAAIGLWP